MVVLVVAVLPVANTTLQHRPALRQGRTNRPVVIIRTTSHVPAVHPQRTNIHHLPSRPPLHRRHHHPRDGLPPWPPTTSLTIKIKPVVWWIQPSPCGTRPDGGSRPCPWPKPFRYPWTMPQRSLPRVSPPIQQYQRTRRHFLMSDDPVYTDYHSQLGQGCITADPCYRRYEVVHF